MVMFICVSRLLTGQYGATGSWLTMPLHSAPGILDKNPRMLMVLGLMGNRFDGIQHINMMVTYDALKYRRQI